jgi:hypothetical protein
MNAITFAVNVLASVIGGIIAEIVLHWLGM